MAPSYTEKQRRFFGAELARKRRGEKTETGMSESRLREFARKRKRKRKHGGLGVKPDSNGYY